MSSSALRTPRNGSVGKAFHILDTLASRRQEMTATALAQATGGSLATTHRFLVTLEQMGVVFRSPRGQFLLGHKLAELGAKVQAPRLLATAVQPHLDALAAEFREVAHCATLHDTVAMDVARALPDRALVGHAAHTRSPLHCTATGKILLAMLEPRAGEHLVQQLELLRHTAHTLTSRAALRRELARVREAEFARDDEEWEEGLRSLAVPVRDGQGRTIAALALSAPVARMPDGTVARIRRALGRRAEAIAHALFTETRVFASKAKPRGSFPHLKRVDDFIFLSGTSARRPDDSFDGADIRTQTRAVLRNVSDMLAEVGAALTDLVELQAYLVQADDYAGFNEAYDEFFGRDGPTRTTLVVRALPHPAQLLMLRATAFKRPIPESS